MFKNFIWSLSALVACAGSSVRAAEIILQPVSASGSHIIQGTEIRLANGGQRVRLEVQIRGFTPSELKTYQARLNAQGYGNGGSVALRPVDVECPSQDSAGHLFCRNTFNETGIGAPRCAPAYYYGQYIGLRCEPGWINQSRTDWLMFGHASIGAVDISSPFYRWGGTTEPGDEVMDEGLTYYAGTLMVDVPAGAIGSYVIGWDHDQSYLQRAGANDITPLLFTAATITFPCTTNEQCDVPCHVALCNTITGECQRQPESDGTTCNDGNACTLGDRCVSGECHPISTVTCTGSACADAGSCLPQTGQCSPPVPRPDGSSCSDGNPCTLNDACAQGVCQSGALRDCTGLPCRESTCNTITGQCRPLPYGTVCDDGNGCTLGDLCVSGFCQHLSTVQCIGDACNDPGACIPETGECPLVPKPDGSACDDGNLCTANQCQQGECLSAAIPDCVQWYDMFDCLLGPENPKPIECDSFDLNSDGFIDMFDVALLLEMY